MKPSTPRDPGKCSRCHRNPVTRPARICATCIKAPKKRRTTRATSRPSYHTAAAVAQRSAATTFPIASEAWYAAQPDASKGQA